MKRPFEAFAAVAFGLFVYLGVLTAYHVSTGKPVSWALSWVGIVGFVFGAFAARNLWK